MQDILYKGILVVTAFVVANPVSADTIGTGDGGTCTEGRLCNPLQFDSLGGFLLGAVDVLITIGAIIGIMGILYSGFLFVTAQGSEDKLKKAKSAFLWSVVGLGVIVGAYVFAFAIQGTIEGLRS